MVGFSGHPYYSHRAVIFAIAQLSCVYWPTQIRLYRLYPTSINGPTLNLQFLRRLDINSFKFNTLCVSERRYFKIGDVHCNAVKLTKSVVDFLSQLKTLYYTYDFSPLRKCTHNAHPTHVYTWVGLMRVSQLLTALKTTIWWWLSIGWQHNGACQKGNVTWYCFEC